MAREIWPEARVLVVDSQTVAEPGHPASRLGAEPQEVLSNVDVVIASPAVAAGLSVDDMPGYFAAVFGYSGGATDVAGAVQALARVRDGCIRHVYAAEESPGALLRVGSGDVEVGKLLTRLSKHEERCIGQLLILDSKPGTLAAGPWLELWGELGALQNRQRLGYREAVLGLLKAEGYEITIEYAVDKQQAAAVNDQLHDIAMWNGLEQDEALIETPLISQEEASALKSARRQLTAEEQRLLTRWRVAHDWALGERTPTLALLEAHRDGLHRRLRWGWQLLNKDGRSAAAVDDENEAARRAGGNYWAPDLCLRLHGPRFALADLLRLPQWLERGQRGEWFSAEDPELLALHAAIADHKGLVAQIMGVQSAQRATTELEQLLTLAGHKLECRRRRCGKGRTAPSTRFYRVVPQDLPQGASLAAMEAQWLSQSFGRIMIHEERSGGTDFSDLMAEEAAFASEDT